MRRLLMLPALMLTLPAAMCQTTSPGIRVERVPVPTPVACVDPAAVPTEPPQVGDQLNGDAVHDLGIVAPSALLLRKWGESLRALIVPGCTTVSPPTP